MDDILLYPLGTSPSLCHAVSILTKNGLPVTDHLTPDATHLLLDVPSHNTDLSSVLCSLPDSVTVIGGNIGGALPPSFTTIDLLADEFFLAENAAITAECAVSLAMQGKNRTIRHSSVLIIGWGRIGKHIARLLQAMQANNFVFSRSDSHRAEIEALGMRACSIDSLPTSCDFILNTAPAVLLPDLFLSSQGNAVKIDLASSPGIICPDVICARGLPGRMAPESAGELIAKTVLRKIKEVRL